MELSKTLHIFLNTLGDLNGKNIIVGFSGGADSTALLDLLSKRKPFFNFNLKAVFFTHGDSPIAVDENIMKDFCQTFCKEREIELEIFDLNLEKIPRQGWESSGRNARQSFYQKVDCDWIFLGHHKNDQNETTMTQLLRGGGKGTVAMKPVEQKYCRPFLNHFKDEIYDYLVSNNLKWIEDPTNTNTDFTRNFWRNVGLPTIEKHYPNYSSSLDKFRKKQEDLYDLAYELALNDGLENFINHHDIYVQELSNKRLKNLLVHIFNHYGKSMEDAFYEQQVKHFMANNKLDLNQKGIELKIENGFMINKISNANQQKKKPL